MLKQQIDEIVETFHLFPYRVSYGYATKLEFIWNPSVTIRRKNFNNFQTQLIICFFNKHIDDSPLAKLNKYSIEELKEMLINYYFEIPKETIDFKVK